MKQLLVFEIDWRAFGSYCNFEAIRYFIVKGIEVVFPDLP